MSFLEFLHTVSPVFLSYTAAQPLHHAGDSYGARMVRHYEVEHILAGEGHILVNGLPVPTAADSLNFRRPGMMVEGIGIYTSRFVQFDLNADGDTSEELAPLPITYRHIPHERLELVFSHFQLAAQDPSAVASHLVFKAALFELLRDMLDDRDRFCDQTYMPDSASFRHIQRAIHLMQNHFDQPVSLQEMAQEAGYSPFHFTDVR